MNIQTPIIPHSQQFYGTKDELDLKAIAFFLSTGFFPSDKTYYKSLKVLKPGMNYELDENHIPKKETPYFQWHYSPNERLLTTVVEEFTSLFESIVGEMTRDKKVILPLSGGLDSRSLASAMRDFNALSSYSYQFENSFDETAFGKQISDALQIPFTPFIIPKGYLWNKREDLASINECYSEFTHARQMAVIDETEKLGNLFLLGHWGDVLFDGSGINSNISDDELINLTFKKVVKEGGIEIADKFWKYWGLEGGFESHLREQVEAMYEPIDIGHQGARLRAFKSMYWAPRWTSINLAIFGRNTEHALPYYDNRMCEFICTVPEELLADRQIQIEYIKNVTPQLARIPWQGYAPCNLYTYKDFHHPKYLPYRAMRKMRSKLSSSKTVLRNWEIQFLGEQNQDAIKKLFKSTKESELFSSDIAAEVLKQFNGENPKQYSHSLSMVITLATRAQMQDQFNG